MKEKIMEIIESDPLVKQIYEDNEGCFRNIVVGALTQSNNDNILQTAINMLALQCNLYDTLLNNIAMLGSKELVEKCNKDINNIFGE